MDEKNPVEEELYPEENLFDEDQEQSTSEDSTPTQDEQETVESKSKEEDKTVSDDMFLKRINEVEGRNYKSMDDYKKTVEERKKAFSQQGQKRVKPTKEKPAVVSSNEGVIMQELLEIKHPETELIQQELALVAKSQGVSILEAYRNDPALQTLAKARVEQRRVEEESKNLVNAPSAGTKKTIDFSNVKSDEDLSKLSDKDKVKFFKEQAKREKQGL